jgi:hypothetical protein
MRVTVRARRELRVRLLNVRLLNWMLRERGTENRGTWLANKLTTYYAGA